MIIWKYKLKNHAVTDICLPRDAKVLFIGAQGEDVFLWAQLDNTKPVLNRAFCSYATGQALPDYGEYIGSAITSHMDVWHIYEVPRVRRSKP